MNTDIFKIRENKNKILALSLIAIFAVTILMAFAQPSLAQIGVIQPEKTVGFASVAPTLIGLGQAPTVNLWVYPLPTLPNDQPGFYGFTGVTVTFIRPDGTKDTFMPTDATGAYAQGEMQALGALFFTHYVPNMVGNWSVSWTMPAQNITDTVWTQDLGNVTQYTGCISNSFSFTVQNGTVLAGLLNGYPWQPLPNANVYWSYPINANNREWSAIAGEWTGVAITAASVNSYTQLRWQPYGPGPNTGHIVWTNQLKEGGIIGGAYGSVGYYGGIVNTGFAFNVIMDGMAYANVPNTTPAGQALGQFRCIDLSTGQVKYQVNGSITCGIHIPGNTYQQSSAISSAEGGLVTLASSSGSYQLPYLWGTATVNGSIYWNYYDPLTGNLMIQLSNCGSARLIDGTVLAFGAQSLTVATDTSLNGYIYRWNMTSVVNNNWNTGITWKVPAPIPITGGVQSAPGTANTYRGPVIFAVSSDDSVIVIGDQYQQYFAYNAATGALLWNLTLNYQTNANEEVPLGGGIDDFIVWNPGACYFDCYSIKTGALLWTTPSVASSPWATQWTVYGAETNDLNNMYIAFPDGAMRAYSLTDGHLLWTSTPIPSTEYVNNVLPFLYAGVVMVGGNIYVYAGYSLFYQIDPVPRFAETICYNATTGDTEWTLNGGVWPNAAANGYVIGLGIFDGNLYCLGKGPTSTTVTAQQQVGGSVLIQGSVLDKSLGSTSATVKTMFPNGVPAISDANMSVWMDYLHMQNSTLLNTPPAVNGIPVSLTAVDPNGNYINIDTVTSDGSGLFKFQWTPTTPGLYTVYATFGGSDSYFSSYAETGATVATVASTTTPAPTATSAPSNLATTTDLMTYIVVSVIVIVIAIAIVGLVLYRKK